MQLIQKSRKPQVCQHISKARSILHSPKPSYASKPAVFLITRLNYRERFSDHAIRFFLPFTHSSSVSPHSVKMRLPGKTGPSYSRKFVRTLRAIILDARPARLKLTYSAFQGELVRGISQRPLLICVHGEYAKALLTTKCRTRTPRRTLVWTSSYGVVFL